MSLHHGSESYIPPVLDQADYRRETLASARRDEDLHDLRWVPRGTVYESIQKLRARFERAGLAAYLGGSDTSRGAPVGNR